MTAIWVIGALLLALLLFLLFTPIRLKIDSLAKQFYVQVWGVATCRLVWQEGPLLRVEVLFFRFTIDPMRKRDTRGKTLDVRQETEDARRGKKSRMGQLKRFLNVLRSFEVKAFRLDLDTSDVLWNGYLYPVFFFLNSAKTPMHINYEGRVELLLHIENRLARMLWAYWK